MSYICLLACCRASGGPVAPHSRWSESGAETASGETEHRRVEPHKRHAGRDERRTVRVGAQRDTPSGWRVRRTGGDACSPRYQGDGGASALGRRLSVRHRHHRACGGLRRGTCWTARAATDRCTTAPPATVGERPASSGGSRAAGATTRVSCARNTVATTAGDPPDSVPRGTAWVKSTRSEVAPRRGWHDPSPHGVR